MHFFNQISIGGIKIVLIKCFWMDVKLNREKGFPLMNTLFNWLLLLRESQWIIMHDTYYRSNEVLVSVKKFIPSKRKLSLHTNNIDIIGFNKSTYPLICTVLNLHAFTLTWFFKFKPPKLFEVWLFCITPFIN